MGRYIKNLGVWRGNAKFLSGSHEFGGSLEISNRGDSIALFRSGDSNIGSIAFFKDSKMGVGTSTPTSKLTVNGDVSITGSILPGASLTYSLGAPSHRWEDLYLGTGSLHLGPTCRISTNEASGTIIASKPFVVEGGLILSSSSYINWSPTTGSTGYGFRDNVGTIEYKNTGGLWLPLGIRNRNAIVTHYTVTSNDNIIGVNATASLVVTLPNASSLKAGKCFIIKDEAGNAVNWPIEVRANGGQTIDGHSSVSLESPYSSINLYCNGTDKYFIF